MDEEGDGMDEQDGGGREHADCGCKVGEIASAYGLLDADTWLVEEWTDGTSVRSLTKQFNEDVIGATLRANVASSLEWSRTPVYEALHEDSLTESETIEIRRELERAGISPDDLAADLVSHQTIYRHLTNCLDATYSNEKTPEERRENARRTVYALQQRTAMVTASTIDSLQSAAVTSIGDPDVLVEITIVCRGCGRTMDFERALEDGCDCPDTPE